MPSLLLQNSANHYEWPWFLFISNSSGFPSFIPPLTGHYASTDFLKFDPCNLFKSGPISEPTCFFIKWLAQQKANKNSRCWPVNFIKCNLIFTKLLMKHCKCHMQFYYVLQNNSLQSELHWWARTTN